MGLFVYKTLLERLRSFRYRELGTHLGLLLIVLTMWGCSTFVRKAEDLSDAEQAQRWEETQKQLASIQDWQLNGRLGLKMPERSGSMSLEWHQKNKAYTLFLDGPFGQSLAEIKGDEHRVVADVAGRNELLVGESPEQIMLAVTGWDLPVSGLKYWVRGVPVPNIESRVTLNGQGQPGTIAQQGWNITYANYRDVDGVSLPVRIKVLRDNVSLNLVISRWQLGSH